MSHLNKKDQPTAVVCQRPDETEFLLPSHLIGLLNEAFQGIYEANDSVGFELRGDDAIWAAMNDASSIAEDHDRIIGCAYSLLPGWAKSREKLEAKFNVKLRDVLHNVSHGFFRGDLAFVEAAASLDRNESNGDDYVGRPLMAN